MKFGTKLALAGGAGALGAAFCAVQNNKLTVTMLEVESERLPRRFDGARVIQLSDLHNKTFGPRQERLLGELKKLKPDAILLTGDLIDSRRTKLEPAVDLARGAVQLAPVFYTPGNHEERMPETYGVLRERLRALGVTVLENQAQTLTRGGESLTFLGLRDVTASGAPFPERLERLAGETEGQFRLVLSHRPELLTLYGASGVELVFSGHAHGGQFILPGIGPVFAPQQGLFPKYTGGLYRAGETAMVVSRGLGPSQFPLRLFNYPDLVCVTLKRGECAEPPPRDGGRRAAANSSGEP